MKSEIESPTKQELPSRVWFVPDEDGATVTDEFILDKIREAEIKQIQQPYELMIGTDSQLHGKQFRFISSCLLYKQRLGGYYWFAVTYLDRDQYKGKQQLRMFKEVELSIDLANWILEETGAVAEIHIDASPKGAGHFTSPFSDQLKGYATASGFSSKIKSEGGFCANCVSDRHTK